MTKENEADDIARSENEGFGLHEMDADHFLYLFLGRVRRKFQADLNLEHIEDAVPKVVEGLTEEEHSRFEEISNKHFALGERCNHAGVEVEGGLINHLKWLLDSDQWESLENLERNRILDFDKHSDAGIG